MLVASLWYVLLRLECFGRSVTEQETHLALDMPDLSGKKVSQGRQVQLSIEIIGQLSQSVDFFVGCSRSTDKCSLQFSLLLLSKLGHNSKTQFTDLLHCLFRILAAEELDIAKRLGQTDLKYAESDLQ